MYPSNDATGLRTDLSGGSVECRGNDQSSSRLSASSGLRKRRRSDWSWSCLTASFVGVISSADDSSSSRRVADSARRLKSKRRRGLATTARRRSTAARSAAAARSFDPPSVDSGRRQRGFQCGDDDPTASTRFGGWQGVVSPIERHFCISPTDARQSPANCDLDAGRTRSQSPIVACVCRTI